MIDSAWLWVGFTILAAGLQAARNAMQRELTGTLGTVGATHVRFLFGFPFAVLSLIGVTTVTGLALPRPPLGFWPWIAAGALTQIFATAMMLAAMGQRSFVVTTAYVKTEPVQVALFGLIFLGDRLTLGMVVAILVATVGVIVMSIKPEKMTGGARPMLLGLAAGAGFAFSAIGYRGAILTLENTQFVMAATFTLAVGLAVQATLLSTYLAIRDRGVLLAIFRAWRPSMLAGLMGAGASQFWFLAFAITSAANVRTLALVEVLFAQAISRFAFGQKTSIREVLGIALVMLGVALLLWLH